MASDMLSIKPGQKCNRCTRSLDEKPYCTIFGDDDKVKEIICEICYESEYLEEYKKDGIITTRVMMEGSMAKYYFEEGDLTRLRPERQEFYYQNKTPLLNVAKDVEEIQKLVDKFDEKHWSPYLKKYWNDSSARGHKYNSKNCTVMMWGCAGRVLITAEEPAGNVTMIFSDYDYSKADEWTKQCCGDTKPRGGIQGICATKEVAVAIMEDLIKIKKIKFSPDDKVTMAGL
jgi:hypothetical protein